MRQFNKRQSEARPRGARRSQQRECDEARVASYQRRIAALGLDDEHPPEDIDEFRNALARRISMFINNWRGCPEPICRRQRGCFAPRGTCTNAKPRPPSSPEDQARLMAQVSRAVKQRLAQIEGEEK